MTGPRSRLVRLRAAAAVLVASTLLLAACSSDGSDSNSSTAETSAPTTAPRGGSGGSQAGPGTPAPRPLPQTETVVVTYGAPIEAFASVILADVMGEFQKENLDVELRLAPPADGTVLLTQGNADVQLGGLNTGQYSMLSDGLPLRIVAGINEAGDPKSSYYLRKDLLGADGQPDPAKLATARVTLGTSSAGFGSAGFYALWLYLNSEGIPFENMRITTIPDNASIVTALENDATDLALLNAPFYDLLNMDCCVGIPETATPPTGEVVMNAEFLEERPEVAKAFVRAMMRTNRTYLQGDYKSDPEVLPVLAEALGVPEADFAQTPLWKFDPNASTDSLREHFPLMEQAFREAGTITYEDNIPVEEAFADDLIDEILAE